LGDFGLAMGLDVHQETEELKTSLIQDDKSYQSFSYSLTDDVGTPFYRAPELELSSKRITTKSDLYAIGIILYEFWRPFSTIMERHECLSKLRFEHKVSEEDCISFKIPSGVVKLIEMLIHPDPELRPTIDQIFASGLIPLKDEENYIEKAIRAIQSKSAPSYDILHERIVDSLFSPLNDPDIAVEMTYNYQIGWSKSIEETDLPKRLNQQMFLIERIEGVFKQHAGIRIDTPYVSPKNLIVKEPLSAVFMDPTGTLVQLPYGSASSFARYASHNSSHFIKNNIRRRYSISKVFRQNRIGHQPQEYYEASFDILWPEKSPAVNFSRGFVGEHDSADQALIACYQAEIIKIIDSIFSYFSSNSARFTIILNHTVILDSILNAAFEESGLSDRGEFFEIMYSYLQKLSRQAWSSVRRTLLKEIQFGEKSLKIIDSLIDLKADKKDALDKLEKLLRKLSIYQKPNVFRAFNDLSLVLKALQSLEIECSVVFWTALVSGVESYKGGIFFHSVLELQSKAKINVKERINIAVGGRYDSMIAKFSQKAYQTPPHAVMPLDRNIALCGVGVTIAIDKLLSMDMIESIVKHNIYVLDAFSRNRYYGKLMCAVLLMDKKGRLIFERMQVSNLLWKNGFIVYYEVKDKHDSAEFERYCLDRNISWVVNFSSKKAQDSADVVFVQNLPKKTFQEIQLKSLISFLLNPGTISEDESAPPPHTSSNMPSVRVITPDSFTPLKPQMKARHIKNAQTFFAPFVSSLDSGTYAIFAVNLDIFTIRYASTAYQKGPRIYDEYLHSCSQSDRLYLEKLFSVISSSIEKNRIELRYILIWSSIDKKPDIISL
jgi:histidyl-tRNA synthetase